jgi:hypothetical protein
VVVAVTSRAEDGRSDYDEVTVACTRDRLRDPADLEEDHEELFFTVDRVRLIRAYPQIDPLDFEE